MSNAFHLDLIIKWRDIAIGFEIANCVGRLNCAIDEPGR